MGRYTTVQTFSDQNTKVIGGYMDNKTAGGEKPARLVTEKVENVSGSCAGAGSEQFHIYRAARRRELTRLEDIEKEDREREEAQALEDKIARNKREADEKTNKNAEKRQKKKAKLAHIKTKLREFGMEKTEHEKADVLRDKSSSSISASDEK